MTVAVTCKDVIEPIICDETFIDAVNMLNISSAKGNTFMVMDDTSGGHVAFNIPNINTIVEVDD